MMARDQRDRAAGRRVYAGRGDRAGGELSRHDSHRARVDAHAREALMMASILFAAGAFTGIMKESGMLAADGPSLRPRWCPRA